MDGRARPCQASLPREWRDVLTRSRATTLWPQAQAGAVRALGVTTAVRSPVLRNVPTIAESGYGGFETTAWWGVFGPAGMPDALTASLTTEIERIAGSEVFRSRLQPLGVTAVAALGGDVFASYQRSEIAKWGKAVRDANVRID